MRETQAQLLTIVQNDSSGSVAGLLVLGAFLAGRRQIAREAAKAWEATAPMLRTYLTLGDTQWAAVMACILGNLDLAQIVRTTEGTPSDPCTRFECAMLDMRTTFRLSDAMSDHGMRPPPESVGLPNWGWLYHELAGSFVNQWFWISPEHRAEVLRTATDLTSQPEQATHARSGS